MHRNSKIQPNCAAKERPHLLKGHFIIAEEVIL